MEFPPNSLPLLVAGLGIAAVAALLWRTARGRNRTVRVVGVGGGGAKNAVEAMIRARLRGVEYIVVNTDARALQRSSASTRIAIGRQITNGLGTGGDAGAGEVAARDADIDTKRDARDAKRDANRDKELAKRLLAKGTNTTDEDLLERSYQIYISDLQAVPYPSPAAIQGALDAAAEEKPEAKQARPEAFFDDSIVRELDQSGFIRQVSAAR